MRDSLPLFPLETVLFPGMVLPLHIFEPRYRKLFAARAASDPIFGVVLTRTGREVGDQPGIHEVGTAATLLKATRYDDGRVDLAVRGGRRIRVLESNWSASYLVAEVEWLPDAGADAASAEAIRRGAQVWQEFAAYLDALERKAGLRIERAELSGEPDAIAYAICSAMPFTAADRQRLLEALSPRHLLEELSRLLRRERELLLATGVSGAAITHPGRRFSAN